MRRIFYANQVHIKSYNDKTKKNHIDIKKLTINKSKKNIAITKIITQSNQSMKRIKNVCVFQTRCYYHDHEKHHERNFNQRSFRDERFHHRSRYQTFHQRHVHFFQIHRRRRFLHSHSQRQNHQQH